MFWKSTKTEELEQRIQDQFGKLTCYHKALQQIAQHVGVDIGGKQTPEQCAAEICAGIDRLAGQASAKVEAGTEERQIPASIRNIKLDGCVNVVIVQGDKPSLTIRCEDKNYLSKVLTNVSGNTLTIDNEPTMITQVGGITSIFKGAVASVAGRDIINRGPTQIAMGNGNIQISTNVFGGVLAEVTVVLPEVSGVRIKGAGKVTYHGFTQDELNIDITGSGDVDLEGKAERLEAEISGSGEVSAYKLTAKTARLRVSGSGDIRATVTQSVRARVSGSGKIKISGNPAERDTDVSGSGKIKFTQFVDNN